MATPRSEKGFLAAIKEAEDKVKALEDKLATATVEEADDILGEKADAELEVAVLTQKFEDFQAKEADKTNEPEYEDDEEESPKSDETAEAETKPKADEGIPEIDDVVFVNVVRGGYMVNPYTHAKFVEGAPSKTIVDRWIVSQIKAGIMEIVTE